MMKSDAEVACAVIGPVLPDENIRCGGEVLSGREWVELQVARSQQPGKQPWRAIERIAFPNGKGGGPQAVLYVLPVSLTKAQRVLADDRARNRARMKARYQPKKAKAANADHQTTGPDDNGTVGPSDHQNAGLASLGSAP